MRCWLALNNFRATVMLGFTWCWSAVLQVDFTGEVPKRPQTHGDAKACSFSMRCPWEHAHVRSCRLAHQYVCPTGSADFLEAYLAEYMCSCLYSCLKPLLLSELAMQNRLNYIARRCLGIACWVLHVVEDCLWLHLHKTDVEFLLEEARSEYNRNSLSEKSCWWCCCLLLDYMNWRPSKTSAAAVLWSGQGSM